MEIVSKLSGSTGGLRPIFNRCQYLRWHGRTPASQPGQIRFESKLIVKKHLMRTILCLFSACSSTIIVIFYTNFMRAREPCTTPHLQTIIISTVCCLVFLAGAQYTINTPLPLTYTTGFNIFLLLFRNSNFSSMKFRPDFFAFIFYCEEQRIYHWYETSF